MFRLITGALLTLGGRALIAGVTLDGSFGTHGALPGPNFIIPATVGKQIGGNLFQSFSQFNLISSESATFSGPNNVQNILSRVTSGSPSSIDGKVSSQIQGANLFFLNPAGVMFGPHAQLDVSGSVAVTTANYVKMVGGGRFNANLGGQDTLTSAPVASFGFLNSAPTGISVTGSTLNVPPEKSFSAVAGDIAINAATIRGEGSRVNLVSVKSPGEAQLDATDLNSAVDVSQFSALGNINLVNSATIDASGAAGGPVVIRGGSLFLDHSQISSVTTGSILGRPMDIALTGALKVVDGALIAANTSGSGNGGDLSIEAESLRIDGSASPGLGTGILLDSSFGSTGNAGDLTISVGHDLSIIGGIISAGASSSGNGGNVHIRAGSLLIDGSATPGAVTGINLTSLQVATGNAGDLTITVDQTLKVIGSGIIFAGTASSGHGGNVSIHAGSLSIDGSATPEAVTGIHLASFATGNAGDVTITVDQALRVVGHGQIEADALSSGNGGNVNIHAGSLSIDGSATKSPFTGISAESRSGATGNAGDLMITVDRALSIVGDGQIEAVTASSGNGGNVNIDAGSLSIDGSATKSQFTGISAESRSGATGDAGDLTIAVDRGLRIVGHGQIFDGTSSSGNGGNLSVHAGSLLIDGSLTPSQFTGISAQSLQAQSLQGATGNAGDLTIAVDQTLSIIGSGEISSSTATSGNGGNVRIDAGSLSIDGSATKSRFTGITAASNFPATGDAGDLTITVDRGLRIVGHGQIFDGTSSSGNGGGVSIHAGSLSINGASTPKEFTGISVQSLSGATGDAGSIDISSSGTINLTHHSSITASSNIDGGNITIKAPVLVSLINSEVNATAGNTGGNITIDPLALQLKNSTISASAGVQGGHIDLFTSFLVGPVKAVKPDGSILLAFNSSITATGGTSNGTVNITAPQLDLGAELITLPSSLVDAEHQLQERCAALLQGDFSSFISIGRGGTEPEPEELQSEF